MDKKSVQANRINVTDLFYCKMLSDEKGGATTYGEVNHLADVMQLQMTPGVSKGVLYGNGVKKENTSRLTGITVVIDANKVVIEVRADMCGNAYENGVLVEGTNDVAPYIAVGCKVEQTNGKNEYIWLLKGQVQPINNTVKQSEDNLTFSTDSITIEFIPRESDGKIRYMGDDSNESFTKEQADKWFLAGPSSYPTASVQ